MQFAQVSFELLLYILSLIIFAHGIEETKFCSNPINNDVPKVYLTIDPISTVSWLGTITQRQLVLNWKWPLLAADNKTNSTGLKGDWIGLFNANVSNGAKLKGLIPLEHHKIDVKDLNKGRIVTKVSLPVFEQPLGVTKQCLGNYFVAYIRDGKVLNSQCMETSPNWMFEMNETIQDVPFTQVMIPGSHDSGAIKQFKGYFAHNIANRYSINQEETIWNQLVMGIRFLDIRVHLYDDQEASIVHGPRNFQKLQIVLEDIKKFLNQTKEIVFLNIHRFSPETERSAKDSSGHQRLKKQLLAMFEKQMVTYSKPYNRKTFGECWKADQRIFVSYNHRSYDKLIGDKLWPGIQSYWSSSNLNSSQLHSFLKTSIKDIQNMHSKNISKPTALMAHISFALRYQVIWDVSNLWFGEYNGIRYMAGKLAEKGLDDWFDEEFWKHTNIVATDFFTSNNLIQIAKESNLRRGNLKHCKDLKSEKDRKSCEKLCI